MLNQCILVGKVINIESDNSTITLLISRNYKEPNEDSFKEDEIDVVLGESLKKNAMQFLSVNATVGVKARIANRVALVENTEINHLAIVAEKLTFINLKQKE